MSRATVPLKSGFTLAGKLGFGIASRTPQAARVDRATPAFMENLSVSDQQQLVRLM
ncbi:hypothetical protein [Ruegeria lacuscaerulensis]|uniref:hypothetical protein n=1 Tax=Ruegeria lacuscaerulensis TaxID=55218 RepID=UPI00147F1DEB|nr:hypothetical protein [Ruegeria lacuscaerulensis]